MHELSGTLFHRWYVTIFGLAFLFFAVRHLGWRRTLIYGVLAFVTPTYALLLGGLLTVTISVQLVASAANGLISTIGQHHLMAGQASTVFNVANTLPALAAFLGQRGATVNETAVSRQAITFPGDELPLQRLREEFAEIERREHPEHPEDALVDGAAGPERRQG